MTPLPTEEPSLVEKLRKRASNWQVWIDDDLEAEIGYLPDHMRYHQALDRHAADEIERLRGEVERLTLKCSALAFLQYGPAPTCPRCCDTGRVTELRIGNDVSVPCPECAALDVNPTQQGEKNG